MSSRFVSSGRIDTQTGDAVASSGNLAPPPPALPVTATRPVAAIPSPSTATRIGPAPTGPIGASAETKSSRTAEWAAVQASVEARRHVGSDTSGRASGGVTTPSISGASEDTRSLYEVLQANKAAKQAAFEEANKIKNQFRPLDEDDVEFLEEVRARKRAEERRARLEEEEGLEGFRNAQRRADGKGGKRRRTDAEEGEGKGEEEIDNDDSVESIPDGRMVASAAAIRTARRARPDVSREEQEKTMREAANNGKKEALREKTRRQNTLLKGIKRTGTACDSATAETESSGSGGESKGTTAAVGASSAKPMPKPKPSLVDYGSDEDDDDDDDE